MSVEKVPFDETFPSSSSPFTTRSCCLAGQQDPSSFSFSCSSSIDVEDVLVVVVVLVSFSLGLPSQLFSTTNRPLIAIIAMMKRMRDPCVIGGRIWLAWERTTVALGVVKPSVRGVEEDDDDDEEGDEKVDGVEVVEQEAGDWRSVLKQRGDDVSFVDFAESDEGELDIFAECAAGLAEEEEEEEDVVAHSRIYFVDAEAPAPVPLGNSSDNDPFDFDTTETVSVTCGPFSFSIFVFVVDAAAKRCAKRPFDDDEDVGAAVMIGMFVVVVVVVVVPPLVVVELA